MKRIFTSERRIILFESPLLAYWPLKLLPIIDLHLNSKSSGRKYKHRLDIIWSKSSHSFCWFKDGTYKHYKSLHSKTA